MKKTLAYFRPLKPAEQKLLECCQSGEMAFIGEERPAEKTEVNEIRAEFLRWLILFSKVEIDPRGIMLCGVWVSGEFDLDTTYILHTFVFRNSIFEETLYLRHAITKNIYISGTVFLKGIHADGLNCQGNLHLREDFEAKSEIRFLGAKIEGNFDCNGAQFKAFDIDEKALNCDGITVLGYVFLRNVSSQGEINFVSAKVGRDFDCSDAKLKALSSGQYALVCDKMDISGTVCLNNNFNAEGKVSFVASKIEGDFIFSDASLKTFNEEQDALCCENMVVFGRFFVHQTCHILKGYLNLTSANVGILADDTSFWQQKTLQKIELDGFTYGHIYGSTSASFRLQNILIKMPEFMPQPYKQLAKVLREMGHDRDADEVIIALNDKRLTAQTEASFRRKINNSKKEFIILYLVHIIGALISYIFRKVYKWTSAYGYRPMRAFGILVSIWFLFGCIYWYGANVAVFAPTNPLIFQKDYNCTIDKNGTPWFASPKDYNASNNWYEASPPEYTTFQPFWYSLDIILPVVDLKMENDWGVVIPSPDGSFFKTFNYFVRILTWSENLIGWILSLLLVAILSGLAKNEKE